jgi:hypothetical protein
MRTERLNEIFSTVKPSLVPLIQAIAASSAKKSYKAPQPLEVCNRELIHTGSLSVFNDIIHKICILSTGNSGPSWLLLPCTLS